MANSEGFVPNERLRRARSLHGWSQAELAERIGTSFEMVSRWERGITIPSLYYRERLCATLGKSDEELGFVRAAKDPLPLPATPFVFLACSHADAEKPLVAHLKATLQQSRIALWSSRQVGRQETTTLPAIIRTAQAIVVIISPEAHSSRHVRTALELARTCQRPVYGVWIEGESWQEYLPGGSAELITSVIDARKGDTLALLEEIAATLQHTEQEPAAQNAETPIPPEQQVSPNSEPPPFVSPSMSKQKQGFFHIRSKLITGLIVLVIVAGVLEGFSLRSYFHMLDPQSNSTSIPHGGTWTHALNGDPDSLIPNASQGNATGQEGAASEIDQALYLPLFYGDSQGIIHAGAAIEVPSIENGGVNANATIWTFHLRPHLMWSDGQPYDARDVDYTWRLWLAPTFIARYTAGLNLISRTSLSPDYLSITFYLQQPYAPFLTGIWVDGALAPLPAHHFRSLDPASIWRSSDNLNPQVTSGPFMITESVPGDHYTLVRNPRYYRAHEGKPYLDKVIFLVNAPSYASIEPKLQAGLLDSTTYIVTTNTASYKRLRSFTDYAFFHPSSSYFEAMYFNFHNTILATHLEVRKAIAMAIDQPALISVQLNDFAYPLCTDHPAVYHPGYDPSPPCPLFELAAASKLLEDNGWRKGADGVRSKEGQRLEFEYSAAISTQYWRIDVQTILQSDFQKIGIRLDVQNYTPATFFGSFLRNAPASPPSGAIAGRYDIAEFANGSSYDPDDSSLLACDQTPPNIDFYCNRELDALYKREQATADPGIRQQIFVQIHHIYLTQFPFIVLNGLRQIVVAKKRTHNFQPGPFYTNIGMWEWWCDQGKC